MTEDFVWRDAGRTVVFRGGGAARALEVLCEHGVGAFELLSTERALGEVGEGLTEAASGAHLVAHGSVPAAAAPVLDALSPPHDAGKGAPARPLVALGGGRVVDVAKAVAAVSGADVVAIPTTLSGAPMTGIHRLPEGAEEKAQGMVRPSLVIADPEAMTGQGERELRASAMNALAHGADTLYLPGSNPVSEMTALRGAELIGSALDDERGERDRGDLAVGAILCGYAIDSAGLGLHHLICQTLVRICGTPHAETNAAILPKAVGFLAARAPDAFEGLATSLRTDLPGLPERIEELGQPQPLSTLGGEESRLDEALEAMLQRPEVQRVPGPPSREDLAKLVRTAW